MRSLHIRAWFGSIASISGSTSTRRDRRAAVGVESMEARVALSSFTAMRPGLIRGVEDPNESGPAVTRTYEDPNQRSPAVVRGVEDPNLRSPGVVSAFNPQPDPPTRSARIIAI